MLVHVDARSNPNGPREEDGISQRGQEKDCGGEWFGTRREDENRINPMRKMPHEPGVQGREMKARVESGECADRTCE